ncbi:MAG: GntR family transcriptional regulator [Burkholderiales bacterium]|nr:GntR family transcriptional regulator [Burkholderiales bacterium]
MAARSNPQQAPAGAAAGLGSTMPDRIARALATRIVDGALAPGQRLVEASIAAEFGVSHGPVRDALRALERQGLVTIAPYRGAVVREVSVREVTELYQVRAALVGLRARWIAEDAGHQAFARELKPKIAALRAMVRATARATLRGDGEADGYVDAALAVNAAFTASVANPWLRSMLESLSMQTARYTRLGLQDARRRRDSAAAWHGLIQAIDAGDGDAAERIARENSLALRDAAIRALEGRAAVPRKKAAPRAR